MSAGVNSWRAVVFQAPTKLKFSEHTERLKPEISITHQKSCRAVELPSASHKNTALSKSNTRLNKAALWLAIVLTLLSNC
jgi:hypothetical protein